MSSIQSLLFPFCSTVCCIVVIIFQYERSTTVSAWSTVQQGPVLYYYSQRRSVLRESATRRWYNNLDDTSAAAASSCSADAAEVDLSDTVQKQERMLASINEKRNAYHNRITKQSSMSSILFDDYTTAATTTTTNENNNKTSTKQQQQQQQLLDIRILLIDNHDSYTYNLYQYLCTMTTYPVHVIMNDAFTSYDEFVASLHNSPNSAAESIIEAAATTTTKPTKPTTLEKYYDCIILSPGPGQPSQPLDMGIILDVIRSNSQLPILGVCLGHQALGYVYGAHVVLAPRGPVHGLFSCIYYTDDTSKNNDGIGDSNEDESGEMMMMTQCNNNCQLFHGLPQNFNVVRYHSLVVDFPSTTSLIEFHEVEKNELEIEPIAWCSAHVAGCNNNLNRNNNADSDTKNDDSSSICMALRHKKYPHYGVQFHPESIGTGVAGYQLLRNFCDFVDTYTNKYGNSNSHVSNDDVDPVGVEDMSPSTAKTVISNSKDENNDNGNSNKIQSKYRVLIHKLDNTNNSRKEGHSSLPLPIQVFEEIYSHNSNSFFLDSSTGENANLKLDDNNDDQDDNMGGCPIMSNSRFSIMGSNDGPLSRKIEYYGREHEVSRQGLRVIHSNHWPDEVKRVVDEVDIDILSYLRQRLVDHSEFVDYAEIITFDDSSVCDIATTGYKLQRIDEFNQEGSDEDRIPFEYRGGYVGYLGYEVRHDTQCRIFEQEGGAGCNVVNGKDDFIASTTTTITLLKTNPNIPTASFLFVDRSLLYDHQAGDWYMIGIIENDSPEHEDCVSEIVAWLKNMKSRIMLLGQEGQEDQHIVESMISNSRSNIIEEVSFVPRKSILQYQNDIARSYHEIRNGESYELCLTNQFEAEIRLPKKHASPFELYKLLRKRNPAPFSSFINLYYDHEESSSSSSQKNTASVSICCSSPERFLSVTRSQLTASLHTSYGAGYSDQYRRPRRQFVVESKPIKGTKARYFGTTTDGAVESDKYIKLIDSQIAIELSQSVKDRAENLMIVDLLRNDLGRVCQVGSIHVPKLMQIESYATVHQMVSTVRGTLDGDMMNVIDVIEACFPGGSMTGAPKQRSMEILNDIEEGVSRGPYSGCLGYISLNGSMDMNIVIRSAILTPMDKTTSTNDDMEEWKVSVGCGGAITVLSDSDDEYDEMLLKSRVVRSAISDWVAQVTEKCGRHISQADDTSLPRHKQII